MNAAPKVSVIIPVYNTEPYLRQCLDSVLLQSFPDFELIIVDDGSTDSSGAICDGYAEKDSRIRVIRQENRGQGYARNVAMDQAVGKYLIFLDSDDCWLPETLETLYAEAEKNRTQVLCFGAIPFWDGMEEPDNHPVYQHTVQNGAVQSGPESMRAALDAGEYYAQPCLRFYLLEYLRSTGLRFDEGRIHEDVTFSFLAYLMAERVVCIGARFYQRRYRPESTMTGKTIQNSAHGYRVAVDGLLDTYDELALSPLGRKQLARYCASRIGMIRKRYAQALAQRQGGWRAARMIQRDVRKTLKRARALPSLPRSTRLATYSLFLGWYVSRTRSFVHRVYKKLKRLLRIS